MTQALDEDKTGQSDGAEAKVPLRDQLLRAATEASSPASFVHQASHALGAHFFSQGLSFRATVLDQAVEDKRFSSAESEMRWARILEAALIDTASEKRSHARHVQAKDGARGLLLSVPLAESQVCRSGAFAVVLRQGTVDEDRARLAELQGYLTQIEGQLLRWTEAAAVAQNTEAVERGIARAASYENPTELAFALTNNLRVRLGCDQVFLGVRRGSRIKILALSGVDDPNIRSSATLVVRQAMEECLDMGQRIVVQQEDDWKGEPISSGHWLHRHWHDSVSQVPVATFPMKVGSEVVAVVALRRPSGQSLTAEEVQKIEQLVEPLGMGLKLLQRATRTLPAHIASRLQEFSDWTIRGRRVAPKVIVASVLCFMLFVGFGKMEHRVRSRGLIKPESTLHYAAPFEGRLLDVHVRAGDRVLAGTPLLQFDTRELDLEARRLERELMVTHTEQAQHVLDGKDADAELARQRARVLAIQLEELNGRRERATVKARENGIVLESELHQRIGEVLPLGEALLSIANEAAIEIELEVSENDVDDLRVGMPIEFLALARPETALKGEIRAIRPVAVVRERKNVVLVQASLSDLANVPWLRPGMEGTAQVQAGSRPVYWLIGHRAFDWFRLEVLP